MSTKSCRYVFIAGDKKGQRCNKMIRGDRENFCYRHRNGAVRQEKYSTLIHELRPDLRPTQIVTSDEGFKLSNMNKDEIVNTLEENVVESVSSSLSKEPPTKPSRTSKVKVEVIEVPEQEEIEEGVKQIELSSDSSFEGMESESDTEFNFNDDELVDEFSNAFQDGNSHVALKLLYQLLTRDLIDNEQYLKLKDEVNKI